MLLNRKGRITDSPIFEKILFYFLNLNDEFLTGFVFAVNIEYGFPFPEIRKMFVFKINDCFYITFFLRRSSFRKSSSKSLFGSSPNNRLKPKSVNGLIVLVSFYYGLQLRNRNHKLCSPLTDISKLFHNFIFDIPRQYQDNIRLYFSEFIL